MVGHVAPEAAHGGPIALVRDGDIIVLDIDKRAAAVELSDDELAEAEGAVAGAGAAVHDRRDGEIRAAGFIGVDRRGDGIRRRSGFSRAVRSD